MKTTLCLAIAIVMISFAGYTDAAPTACPAGSPICFCQNAMSRLMVSKYHLDRGLLTYYENVNIHSEQNALTQIENFFQDLNLAELQCVETDRTSNTADLNPTSPQNQALCREDMTILRFSAQAAYETITQSDLEDIVTVKSSSVKQQRIWNARQDILNAFDDMFNLHCGMFNACSTFLTNYNTAYHNFIYARSLKDTNALVTILNQFKGWDVAHTADAASGTYGTGSGRFDLCSYMYNFVAQAVTGPPALSSSVCEQAMVAPSALFGTGMTAPEAQVDAMITKLGTNFNWEDFDVLANAWIQFMNTVLNGPQCSFQDSAVRQTLGFQQWAQ